VRIREDAAARAEHGRPVPADQLRERGVVAPGRERRDEIGIGRRVGGRPESADHPANGCG
jgi:hypothetical protein